MPIPVITVAQMREWEKVTWASGVKEDAVMRQAGEAVSRLAERLTRPDDLILFLAGKGHNGDDTVYAFESVRGRRPELLRVIDADIAANELAARGRSKPALMVDGLFGIGLNRPLSGAWMKLIDQINQPGCRILAVDVPSGLSADTGLPLDTAIRATVTLTLAGVKQGLLQTSACPFVGRLEVAREIGLVPYPFSTELRVITPEDFVEFPPRRPVSGHKGSFGHLAILAGSLGYHGAAVLAARGAQRAHPGLITLFTQEAVYLPVAAQTQAVMVEPVTSDFTLPATCTAILVGPGLAARDLPSPLKRTVGKLWLDSPLAMVADASALEWLPSGPCAENALRVLTPHPGEAARLLKCTAAEVQHDRVAALRELSQRWGGAWVVLKGHQTVIGRERGELFVNISGNPYLAQGGSGDLLAGYLGGLLSQPELQRDPGLAVCYGVWQHGATADSLLAGRGNYCIEDLAAELGRVRP